MNNNPAFTSIKIRFLFLAILFVVLLIFTSFVSLFQEKSMLMEVPRAMPPHPDLEDRIERGEAELPRFMTDPEYARKKGINQPRSNSPDSVNSPNTPDLVGNLNTLAVLVDFSDKTSTVTATYFDSLIFATPIVGRGSVRDYFDEVSYSQVDIVTVNMPSSLGWRRADQTYSYYVGRCGPNCGYCTDSDYPNNCQKLAEDIVNAIDDFVNFSNYDNDGDGHAEPIMLIHAGQGAEYTGSPNDIWSHSWGMSSPQLRDGVYVQAYTIQPEYWQSVYPSTSDMTIGVFAHEMGHGFWDLPDLYDRDYSSNGVGDWSLMAGGSWNGPSPGGSSPAWPDAWSRVQMGFITPALITANTTGQTIPQVYGNPAPTDTIFRLDSTNLGTQEYFLIENRQKASGSYDEYLPGSGLLIWHVDEAMNSYSLYNNYECTTSPCCNCSDTQHFLVKLEQADGLLDMENDIDQGDAGDPFPGSTTNRTWNNLTNPESSSWYTCENSCIAVTNISDSGSSMTADLQVDCTNLEWLGNTTSWNNDSNWSGGTVPTCSDNVRIPTSPSGGNFPTIDANVEVGNLTLQTGAVVNMSANTLGICGNLDVQGTAQFNATGGTIVFQGGNDQTITMPDDPNNQLYNVEIGDGTTQQKVVLGSNLDINGNLTIRGGNTFQPSAYLLSVAGNWVDVEGGFLTGTSTVVFDGNSTQTAQITETSWQLVNEDFSEFDGDDGYIYFTSPSGWAVENTSGDNYEWGMTGANFAPNSTETGHARHWATSSNATTWLFTSGLNLRAGISYQLTFENGVETGTRGLRVALGNAQNSASMGTVLQDYTVNQTSWTPRSINFSVSTDGVYYLGFRSTTGSGQPPSGLGQALDDIVVTAVPKLLFYNLVIDTANTNFTLDDDALVQNNLVINNGGQLHLSTNNLEVDGTLTNNGTLIQQLNVPATGTTRFLHVTDGGSTDKYLGVDITPYGTALGDTTVTIRGNQTQCNVGDQLIHRCFDVAPTNALTATVRFWYLDSESNGQDPANMNAYHWNTSTSKWDTLALATTPRGGTSPYFWVEAVDVDSYSPFGLSDGNTPTAVTVGDFVVTPNLNRMLVNWEVFWDSNISGFNLYRSESLTGEQASLGFVPLQLSSAVYEFVDSSILSGKIYYYWLEVIGGDNNPVELLGPVVGRSDNLIWLPAVQK